MEIIINHEYGSKKELKEIVELSSQFEKEYSCNCTLNLNKINSSNNLYENSHLSLSEYQEIGERILNY